MNQIDSPKEKQVSGERSKSIARLATLLFLCGFGIFALIASWKVGLGSLHNPGPGLWPLITSAGILIPTIILLFFDQKKDYEAWSRRSLRLLLALVVLFLYIPIFLMVGFLISSFALLVVWLRWFGKESWRSTLIVSAASSLGLYILLDVLLGVPLPNLLP